MKVHDHACVNCFTDKGPCLGECNIQDENNPCTESTRQKELSPRTFAERDIANRKLLKEAIAGGFQGRDFPLIDPDELTVAQLEIDAGKAWLWYNLTEGF